MEQHLHDLEAALGVPAGLLQRAAAARGGVSGRSPEDVVMAWTGGEAAPAAPTAAPAAPAPAAPAPAALAPAPAAPAAAPPPSGPPVEVLEPAAAIEPAVTEPEVAAETGGVLAGFPGWLSAALIVVPLLALLYVMIAPDGPRCGASGQLAIDAETGLAENCDGTEYGVDVVSFFTIGQEIYNGSGRCAGCHGDAGGGGTGPAMAGGAVLVTFPAQACADHIRWVELGSTNWPEATYGAAGTPVGSSGAAMPGFEGTLTLEELTAVVIYERVAFGGQPLPDAEADCGTGELEMAAGG